MRDNRGMSLVELITSIAIFGMVAAAALSMILFATRTNEDITIDTMHNIKVVSAFDLMKEQVREGSQITVWYEKDAENNLVLKKFRIDSSSGMYKLITNDFAYEIDSENPTVLFSGVKRVLIQSSEININDTPNTEEGIPVTDMTLIFEFEEHDPMQLVISCRNK